MPASDGLCYHLFYKQDTRSVAAGLRGAIDLNELPFPATATGKDQPSILPTTRHTVYLVPAALFRRPDTNSVRT